MAAERNRNFRRIGLQFAFWAVLGLLLLTILQNFVNISQTSQLSAYGDDWNDMSAFREDINSMGIETKSLALFSSQTLKILVIQPTSSLVLKEIHSPSPNLMRMVSLRLQLRTDIPRQKSIQSLSLWILEVRSSFSKTLVMQEASVKRTVYGIPDINCMTQITFLNSTEITSGCVFRPTPAVWKEPPLHHQQSRSMSVGHPMSEPTLALN